MPRTLMLALLLLSSAAWLQAQPANPPSGESKSSEPTTIQGCLQTSGGIYNLTESDGTVHRLSRYANKLSRQVGHEVRITGKPGVKTLSSTQQNIASSATEIPVFNVKTVTLVADTCKAPGK